MYLTSVILTVLALTGPAYVNAEPSEELTNIFEEFRNLLSEEQYELIFYQYLFTDSEFQGAANYVQTNEFKDFVRKIDSNRNLLNVYDYLEEAGLPIYQMMNELHDLLNLPNLSKPSRRQARQARITGGTAGFIADVRAGLPKDKIAALHKKKLETSPAFARFIEYIRAPRFQELLDAVEADEELQQLFRVAKSGGVDVKALASLMTELWGIEFPVKSRSLKEEAQNVVNKIIQFFRG